MILRGRAPLPLLHLLSRRGFQSLGWAVLLCSFVPPGVTQPLESPVSVDMDDVRLQCLDSRSVGNIEGLRELQRQLLKQLPDDLAVADALETSQSLLVCSAPRAALQVLDSINPEPEKERLRWLEMRWQAAHQGLLHDEAASALRELANGDLSQLETVLLPVGPQDQAAMVPAMDLLADHLESLERPTEAAAVLLSSRQPGVATAARWGKAMALLQQLPPEERDQWFEQALEQAAAAQAWGLVAALLDQQIADGDRNPGFRQAMERRLRLSRRIDDAYGEWQLRHLDQDDAASEGQLRNLDLPLRSPRDPGGHTYRAEPSSPLLSPLP